MNGLSRFRRSLDDRLQPQFLEVLSWAALLLVLCMTVVMFATSDRGRTAAGPALGADLAGFLAAAEILERGQDDRLYDREFHAEVYHELLPNLAADLQLPYVHPPFVAALFRPFTRIPYEAAVAVWMAVSLVLYVAALVLVWRTMSPHWLPERRRIFLFALTFEPFLLEAWNGGQLSAIACLAFAAAWFHISRHHFFTAGLALGICFYKPTFLLLAIPFLLVARQWRMLLGLTVTGLLLALLSLITVGPKLTLGYLDVLLAFRNTTEGTGNLALRTWKYVDLRSFSRLLTHTPSWPSLALFLAAALPLVVYFLRKTSQYWHIGDQHRCLLWGALLTLTPVLNVYVGFYDASLIPLAAMLTGDALARHSRETQLPDSPAVLHPLLSSGAAYLFALVAISGWASQPLARAIGLQVITVTLIALGIFQLFQLKSLSKPLPD